MNHPLLSQAEAAEYLNIPEQTLRVWRHRHLGPAYLKVGRHVRYRTADLDRFAESRVVEPQGAA
jgi:excisionase family DNA binding protein